MSDHWDIYFCDIQGKFSSIVLDMDIWKEIEKSEYPHPMVMRIPIKNPGKSGTPIHEEAELLNDLEDKITNEISGFGFLVGRITTDGLRDVFYYFSKPYELEKVAEKYFIEHGYEIQVHHIEEENPWDFYFEYLYPNKYQLQHMGNRKVVDQLRESGDTFENSRRVDHWIYFQSTEDKENFDAKAILLGFNIDSDPSHDEKMCTHIYRSDYVDFHSINQVTDILVDLAGECNGEYDGWGTTVVK
ncbi:MAG: DUF695 domain-containing protein [Paenibacillus dendritiformis]|uniref:DUF695 domain-containing protein n=1 Tax=uncultured Paenibacillus sp. TaxID=227322 RepID=UPI0025F1EF2E|nr:DUF695 domain-containing protein [uncultured Paenibacillus sp.]MDU5142972.1 DUF695 domain-containing protein [Paenibacillus dendritiformis]